MPISPSSKHASISARGIFDSSSIRRTSGRIRSSANSRTAARKSRSSESRSVRGRLRASVMVVTRNLS